MAVFELKLRRRGIPESELVDDLQRVAIKIAALTVTRNIYDQHGQFGATTVLRKFGTWNRALTAAGLALSNRLNIADKELFENLAAVWQSIGRQPFGSDITKATGKSIFSLGTYEKRFGSWNKALTAFIEYINGGGTEAETREIEAQSTSTIQSGRTPKKINWRLRATVLIRDSCICRMCGSSPAKDPTVVLHVDHMVPWSKGGETVPDNLQTLCSVCNIGKSDLAF